MYRHGRKHHLIPFESEARNRFIIMPQIFQFEVSAAFYVYGLKEIRDIKILHRHY